jgi:hypothetical protein
VTITEKTLEATADGYSSRLDLAAIRSVSFDDSFVVLMIDPTLDFFIPKRCLGDDRAAEAFKAFIEARREIPSPRADGDVTRLEMRGERERARLRDDG